MSFLHVCIYGYRYIYVYRRYIYIDVYIDHGVFVGIVFYPGIVTIVLFVIKFCSWISDSKIKVLKLREDNNNYNNLNINCNNYNNNISKKIK